MNNLTKALTAAALVFAVAVPARAGWNEGVAAFKAGNYSSAAKEFQDVVKQRPDWAGGHFMLGQALARLNRKEQALDSFRKAYDLDPNKVEYQLALANGFLQTHMYTDAARLLDKIDASSLSAGQRGTFSQMRAVALEKSGRSGDALGALRDAARSKPNDAAVQYQYGVAAFNAGQISEAVRALGQSVKISPSTESRAAYVQALIREARENPAQKSSSYATAVEQAKVLAGQNASYENILSLGEAQLGAKRYAGAIDSFQKAAAKKSGDWLAFYYASQAQTALGQYENASASLKKALATNPSAQNQRRVYKQIGFVDEKLKNYEEAKAAYAKAGDQASLARVEKNMQIAQENQKISAENQRIEEMRKEQQDLEKQLKDLKQGAPPPLR
jgi:tetratricopeptide (TPR) repeat protein